MGSIFLDNLNDNLNNIIKTLRDAPILPYNFQEVMDNIARSLVDFSKATVQVRQQKAAIDKLAEKQIVFTELMTQEMAQQICANEDVETIVLDYYNAEHGSKYCSLINRIEESNRIEGHRDLYNEIKASCCVNNFQLACMGLFALLDGVLAEATGVLTNPKFIKRLDVLRDKIDANQNIDDDDLQLYYITESIMKNQDMFFNGPKFDRPEDINTLNRNWLQHGRTHKTYTQMDSIKALLLLEAVIILSDAGET